MRPRTLMGAVAVLAASAGVFAVAQADEAALPPSNTVIKHVVVIFGENESFDHYFGTYPNAANPGGQPTFNPVGGTPIPQNLQNPVDLITTNPNAELPRRLDRSEAVTCGHNHGYGAEQAAFNNGQMDKFVENTNGCGQTTRAQREIVMSYYDGNTVTAMWNIAQKFAISDRFFGSTYGPSTIGALNIISGNTHGVEQVALGVNGTMIGNSQPALDDCSAGKGAGLATMSGRTVGDLMNDKGMTWGWFAGGFKPTRWEANGDAVCEGIGTNAAGGKVADYLPHHEPFQYYRSTANRHHVPPSSVGKIGYSDEANHQYDLTDFDKALAANNLPQVSFLKAISAEDSHPGYSGPLDEQHFVARVLNALQRSPDWDSTAVFLAYDDSDGWYDHFYRAPLQGSRTTADALNSVGACGPLPAQGAYHGRCGPGPRLPLLAVSPWARQNHIDSTPVEQASITRFIEDNWDLGRIGDQSFDDRTGSYGSLLGMFDLAGPTRAPQQLFDAETGQIVPNPPTVAIAPARADPGPRPMSATLTPTATATIVPTVVPTPVPKPKPKLAVKLTCKPKGLGKRITVSCTATGNDASLKSTLRFELRSGKKVLATARGTLSKKKVKVVIKPKRSVKAGKYTLRITLSQGTRTTITTTKTIRLKK